MSVCVSVIPICAANKELNLISKLVLCLYMKITTCLPVLFNQSRDSASELVSSLFAYESSLVYLEQNFLYDFHMISMILICITLKDL